jgi:hypothetical protein
LGRRAWEGENQKALESKKAQWDGFLMISTPVLSISITCMTGNVAKEINLSINTINIEGYAKATATLSSFPLSVVAIHSIHHRTKPCLLFHHVMMFPARRSKEKEPKKQQSA